MEYRNGSPLSGHAPAGAQGTRAKRISRREVTRPGEKCGVGEFHGQRESRRDSHDATAVIQYSIAGVGAGDGQTAFHGSARAGFGGGRRRHEPAGCGKALRRRRVVGQPRIKDQQIVLRQSERIAGLQQRPRIVDGKPRPTQRTANGIENRLVIFDEQDPHDMFYRKSGDSTTKLCLRAMAETG